MTYPILVNIINTWNDLLTKSACFIFLKSFSFDNVIEQFSSWSVFHDQEQLSWCFDNLWWFKIIKYAYLWVLTSYSWITLGCLTIFKMCISLVTLSTSLWSLILSFSKIFIATFSYVIKWVPSLTFPNVPYPSDRPEIIDKN